MIPVCEPLLDGNEKKYVDDCLNSGWISSAGKYVTEFEEKFAKYCGCKYGVTTTSGTTALHLALASLGIGPGDEVIVPTFTIAACAFAVLYTGATPVFVDCDPVTYNIDPEKMQEAITDRTRAIMPVHIYGHMAEMDKIMEIVKGKNIFVVEDAAEAHGSEINGRRAGSIGHVGCFSFYGNKVMTCLTGDTRIVTVLYKKGRGGSRSKAIKDIKLGDSVVSYDLTTGEKVLDEVTQCFKRETNTICKVLLSNKNELDITDNHPVFVVGKGWTEVCNLRVGDELIQYNYFGLINRIREKQNTGKKRVDLIGEELYVQWHIAHSTKISLAHKNPNSGYNKMDVALKDKHISEGQKRFYQTERGKLVGKESGNRARRLYADPLSAFNSPEHKLLKSKRGKEVAKRPGVLESRRLHGIKNWENPEYRERVTSLVNEIRKTPEYIQSYIAGLSKTPNKAELKLQEIINGVCPDYKFNGGYELGITIGSYIPDFVNVNGKKKVIELFGRHWHEEYEIAERKDKMATLGWDCLVIWDSELTNQASRDNVATKIKTFNYNPNVELVKVVSIAKLDKTVDVYNIETKLNHNYYANGILVHNCGEGGMLVTNDGMIAAIAQQLKDLAHSRDKRFLHMDIGYNYRMCNTNAAIGVAQLESLDYHIELRRQHAARYTEQLDRLVSVPVELPGYLNTYWMYAILLKNQTQRDGLMRYLDKVGIGTRTFFIPMNQQPILDYLCVGQKFPIADNISKRGLYLPSGTGLSDGEIDVVCDAVKEYLRCT